MKRAAHVCIWVGCFWLGAMAGYVHGYRDGLAGRLADWSFALLGR